MEKLLIHIIPTLGSGGAENVLCSLVEDFNSRGIKQYVFTTQGNLTDFNHKRISAICEVVHKKNELEKIKQVFKENPHAILLGWMYKGITAAHGWKSLYGKSSQKIIWNIRHSNFGPSQYYQKTMLYVFGLISRITKPKIIYCSYRSKLVHESAFFSKKKKEVIVNRLAKLPPATIKITEQLPSYLLFVGRFNPQKGPEYLREISQKVLKIHPDLQLWIAGNGWDLQFFPENIRSRVKILGQQKEIYPLYKNAAVYLFTSTFGEGYPNVLVEAMAVGTPIVAFDAGDSIQILNDYPFGSIARDTSHFVDLTNGYLNNPLPKAQREEEANRQCKQLRFSITLEEYHSFIFQ